MTAVEFTKELIKGRIAEIIFEQMFRETGRFTIQRFGYEYIIPQLAQYQNLLGDDGRKALENIRHTPDFILITENKQELYFVEVKYRARRRDDDIKGVAEVILKKWDHAWLFVASPDGFFFEPCNTIVNNNGKIGPLYETTVRRDIRDAYLKLLNKFNQHQA